MPPKRDIAEKRIAEYHQLAIEHPFNFPIKVSPEANDDCLRYVEILEKARKQCNSNRKNNTNTPIEFPDPIRMREELAEHEDSDSLYIIEIHKYFFQYLQLSHGVVQGSISAPLIKEFLPTYYYVYCISINSYLQKKITKDSFIELLNICETYEWPKLRDNLCNMIVKNLHTMVPDFYINEELALRLQKALGLSNKYLMGAIEESCSQFVENNLPAYEHNISKGARLAWETPLLEVTTSTVPSFLRDDRIVSWPSISIARNQNFTGNDKVLYSISPSISELAKFQSHLRTPGLAKFSLDMSDFGLSPEQDDTYNEVLTHGLIKGKFLNSAGDLVIESVDKGKFTKCCIGITESYLKKKHPRSYLAFQASKNSCIEHIKYLFDIGLQHKKEAEKSLEGLSPVKAVALFYQMVEVKPLNTFPEKFKECLLKETTRTKIHAALLDTMIVADYIQAIFLSNVPNTSNVSNFHSVPNHKKAWELSEKVVLRVEAGHSIILQTGNPYDETVSEDKQFTKHIFYTALKRIPGTNAVKIIIVNGGDTSEAQDVVEDYIEQDRGVGAYWKCRETNQIDLSDASAKEFLTHYIYKTLILPYTPFSDKASSEWSMQELVKNIYFKSADKFLGRGIKLKYLPTICDTPSEMPSQVFGNCTIYNLKHALDILLEFNIVEFANFNHHSICSYNYLLHQNNRFFPSQYRSGAATAPVGITGDFYHQPNGARATTQAPGKIEVQDLQIDSDEKKGSFTEMIIRQRVEQRLRSNSF